MTPLRIELAWPPRQLSPNGRVHFMEKHRFAKAAKSTAYWLTRQALGHDKFTAEGDIAVAIVAHPIAGKPSPDLDNALASMKAFLDGIALGLGVDDKRFCPTIAIGEHVPGGRVIVTVGA